MTTGAGSKASATSGVGCSAWSISAQSLALWTPNQRASDDLRTPGPGASADAKAAGCVNAKCMLGACTIRWTEPNDWPNTNAAITQSNSRHAVGLAGLMG